MRCRQRPGRRRWCDRASPDADAAEAARHAAMDENAVKVAAHRLRRRYRETIREEIANTVAEEEDVEERIPIYFGSTTHIEKVTAKLNVTIVRRSIHLERVPDMAR